MGVRIKGTQWHKANKRASDGGCDYAAWAMTVIGPDGKHIFLEVHRPEQGQHHWQCLDANGVRICKGQTGQGTARAKQEALKAVRLWAQTQ